MAEKGTLKIGQRVKFRRTHDKAVELTGAIVKLYPDAPVVDIETEVDGKLVEVETIETAHITDVTVISEPKKNGKEAAAKKNGKEAAAKKNGKEAATAAASNADTGISGE